MIVKARGGIAGGEVMCGQRHDSGAVSHPAVQSRPLRDAIDYRMQEAESDATQRSESRCPDDRDGARIEFVDVTSSSLVASACLRLPYM